MERHWRDAELLFDDQKRKSLGNADHLYGFAAECGLKALMLSCGMEMHNGKPRNREDCCHVDKLLRRYQIYMAGIDKKYVLSDTDFFKQWNIDERYAKDTELSQDQVKKHRSNAEKVRDMIKEAQKDGLLP